MQYIWKSNKTYNLNGISPYAQFDQRGFVALCYQSSSGQRRITQRGGVLPDTFLNFPMISIQKRRSQKGSTCQVQVLYNLSK